MLKTQADSSFSPEIEQVVVEMVKDDNRYLLTEMRSMHREHLVVPVKLIFKQDEPLFTFSRNISPVGICLIGNDRIDVNQIVDLEIYRLSGRPITIMSDVRWCKPFGPGCFMSGWKFLQLRR